MPQRNLLILLLAIGISYACYVRAEQNPFARYVAEALVDIDQNALDHVPDRSLFDGAMNGMVGVLNDRGDPHSEFLNREEADPLRSEIRQQFGGVGVRIGFEGEPRHLTVVGPPDPGSPAAREGLRSGDQIVSIDGRLTTGLEMMQVLSYMRGMPGTKVQLVVQPAGDAPTRTVDLVREIINIESVLGDRRSEDGTWQFKLQSDPRIAHIRIASFGDRTPYELQSILQNVTASGAKAVILDLRDDAGGSLDSAVEVCKLLLPANKLIVETRGRNDEVLQRYMTTENGPFRKIPLAVLVNQESASAAEIVAACLQDHHRAAVAGQRSYGKGTVQQLLPLESGRSLLKLTWASFWRPSNTRIHRDAGATEKEVWGVVPDAKLEYRLTADEFEAFLRYRGHRDQLALPPASTANSENAAQPSFVDEQLQRAMKHLQSKLGELARPASNSR